MSDHEHTEPAPDERVEGVEDLDVPADEQADVADAAAHEVDPAREE